MFDFEIKVKKNKEAKHALPVNILFYGFFKLFPQSSFGFPIVFAKQLWALDCEQRNFEVAGYSSD